MKVYKFYYNTSLLKIRRIKSRKVHRFLRLAMPALLVMLATLPTHADDNAPQAAPLLPRAAIAPELRTNNAGTNPQAGIVRVDDSAPGEIALADASGSDPIAPHLGSPTTPADSSPPAPPPPPASLAPSISASTPPAPAASPNAMVNLVNILVAQHAITKDAGDKVIQQAQQEAAQAQAQIAAVGQQTVQPDASLPAGPGSVVGGGPSGPIPAEPAQGEAVTNPQTPDDEVHVSYVPDTVKDQISDEVTARVLKQTHADTDSIVAESSPDWVKRFHVTGDIRLRYEDDMFPSGNAVGNFTNFNAINTGSGFNVNTTTPVLPQNDVDQDRQRLRMRARLGADIDLADNFTAGFRLATGSDNSPTTENQTLGGVNSFTQGQGGNFGKYEAWIDRAFLRYEIGNTPGTAELSFTGGRFDNPFFHTSMIWSDDLAFDGAAIQGRYQVAPGVTPFFAGGAFPIFNTDLNFST